MEFSEAAELKQVVKINMGMMDQYSASPELNEDLLMKYQSFSSNILGSTPKNSFTSSLQRYRSDSDYFADGLGPENHTALSANLDSNRNIEIIKDEEYLQNVGQPQKVSSLTESIKNKSKFESESSENQILIHVYFFETTNVIDIMVSPNLTVANLKRVIISKYIKSPLAKTTPLPNGTNPNAYEVWLMDDYEMVPDTDFFIDEDTKLADLTADALAFCCSSTYISEDSKIKSASLRRLSEISQGTVIKVQFHSNWTVLSVNPKQKLRDLMGILSRKFSWSISPYTHEFRMDVEIDENFTTEECPVDIDMYVKTLKTTELKLCKKKFKDSPPGSPRSLSKNKRFEVAEITKDGKTDKILTISKHFVSTETQESQEFASLNLMTIWEEDQNPIKISSIENIWIDKEETKKFYIQYRDNTKIKQRVFEAKLVYIACVIEKEINYMRNAFEL